MQSASSVLVVLGTGGTISGRGRSAADQVDYRPGELAVDELLHGVSVPAGLAVEAEQVAQLDSKDMDVATWQRLARRAAHHLARPEVRGVIVTHGTDTLEETAWLLLKGDLPTQRELAGFKVPRRIEQMHDLPREDSGKILKRKLRDRFWQGQQRRI